MQDFKYSKKKQNYIFAFQKQFLKMFLDFALKKVKKIKKKK